MESKKKKMFCYLNPELTIFSDASLQGWGAVLEGSTTNGPWTYELRTWHINELELLAAFLALQTFTKYATNMSVLICMDNTVAVSYINRDGGSRSRRLNGIVKDICNWCEERSISLRAEHVPGVTNTITDAESRSNNDSSDWQLDRNIFQKIRSVWTVDIDLFASCWNAQLPRFISWKPQPNALSTNALSFGWSTCAGYAFPPFSLISKCLTKIRREKAELVLVCPYWPSQSRFPDLLQLACNVVLVLPPGPGILVGPMNNPHPLSDQGHLLTAWKLSAIDFASSDFRTEWSAFCWEKPATPRMLLTLQPGSIGSIDVAEGVRIPCQMI
jgi:ribonuclease HI